MDAEKIEAPHLGAFNLNTGSYGFRALPWVHDVMKRSLEKEP